jgi:hypothetical protein
MHTGYYSRVTPKFYLQGDGNDARNRLNKQFESQTKPFNPDIYDRKYFSEEVIRGFSHRHTIFVAEQIKLGGWIVKRASDLLEWK